MGTNVYMRRIPTAAQKEELKGLLKKQYEEAIESILQFFNQEGWQLFDEYGDKIDPDSFWEEYVTRKEDGWTGETFDRHEREQGHYAPVLCASYEHVTSAGLRFARDADFS